MHEGDEMDFDPAAAEAFVQTHARVLERRRLDLLLGRGSATDVIAALDAYRNADGGYGWGLEPDLRSSTSQPVGAMQALEVLAEIGDRRSDRPGEILDWLAEITCHDGGVPFALAYSDTAGSASHWVGADPSRSSLQMTTQLAAQASRLARHRTDVAGHPWLASATDRCLTALEQMAEAPQAYELMFSLRFLDAVAPEEPRAVPLLERLSTLVVADGPTPVQGGAAGEVLHLLDFTPYRDTLLRSHFSAGAVTADLERLASQQQPDGGWTVDYPAYSPAAALEWRGHATLRALQILRAAP